MQIPGSGSRQAKLLMGAHGRRPARHIDWYAWGVCRSDGSRKTNSPFHTISKISRIVHISAVVVVGINEGVDDAHHDNSILKASKKSGEDGPSAAKLQRVSKPKRRSCTGEGIRCCVRENRVQPDIHLNIFIANTQYEIVVSYTGHCKECVEY